MKKLFSSMKNTWFLLVACFFISCSAADGIIETNTSQTATDTTTEVAPAQTAPTTTAPTTPINVAELLERLNQYDFYSRMLEQQLANMQRMLNQLPEDVRNAVQEAQSAHKVLMETCSINRYIAGLARTSKALVPEDHASKIHILGALDELLKTLDNDSFNNTVLGMKNTQFDSIRQLFGKLLGQQEQPAPLEKAITEEHFQAIAQQLSDLAAATSGELAANLAQISIIISAALEEDFALVMELFLEAFKPSLNKALALGQHAHEKIEELRTQTQDAALKRVCAYWSAQLHDNTENLHAFNSLTQTSYLRHEAASKTLCQAYVYSFSIFDQFYDMYRTEFDVAAYSFTNCCIKSMYAIIPLWEYLNIRSGINRDMLQRVIFGMVPLATIERPILFQFGEDAALRVNPHVVNPFAIAYSLYKTFQVGREIIKPSNPAAAGLQYATIALVYYHITQGLLQGKWSAPEFIPKDSVYWQYGLRFTLDGLCIITSSEISKQITAAGGHDLWEKTYEASCGIVHKSLIRETLSTLVRSLIPHSSPLANIRDESIIYGSDFCNLKKSPNLQNLSYAEYKAFEYVLSSLTAYVGEKSAKAASRWYFAKPTTPTDNEPGIDIEIDGNALEIMPMIKFGLVDLLTLAFSADSGPHVMIVNELISQGVLDKDSTLEHQNLGVLSFVLDLLANINLIRYADSNSLLETFEANPDDLHAFVDQLVDTVRIEAAGMLGWYIGNWIGSSIITPKVIKKYGPVFSPKETVQP